MGTKTLVIALPTELEVALNNAADIQGLSLGDYIKFCLKSGLLLSSLMNDSDVEVIIRREGKEQKMVFD